MPRFAPAPRPALFLAGLAALATAGCSSSLPAKLVLSSGDVLTGSATTTVNGQFFVQNTRVNCSGIYEGRNLLGVGRRAPVTVTCSNGKTGTSQDSLYLDGRASLTMSDRSKAVVTIGDGQ